MGRWTLSLQGSYADFDAPSAPQHGWLAGLTARYSHRAWQATAAASWFDVQGYYARIYQYESSFQYAASLPTLTGRGLRAYAMLRYKPLPNFQLGIRYALTCHVNPTTLRHQWHTQLTYNVVPKLHKRPFESSTTY